MRIILPALLGLTLCTVAPGDVTVSDIVLGDHATGPTVTMDDLKGRVVIVEYWGVKCPMCRSHAPSVTRMAGEYSRNSVVFIAAHAQHGGADLAGDTWNSLSRTANHNVTVVDRGGVRGAAVDRIPTAIVFDHTGKKVFQGNPTEMGFKQSITKAARENPGFLVAGREYTALQREAATIGSMSKNMSSTLRRLREITEAESDGDTDSAKRDEASHLLQKVTTWATHKHKAMAEKPEEDALRTMAELSLMVKLLRGDALGKPFVELQSKLKSDANFKDQMAAAKMLMALKEHIAKQNVQAEGKGDFDLRKRAVVVQQARQIAKRYPDTVAGFKADQIATRFGE